MIITYTLPPKSTNLIAAAGVIKGTVNTSGFVRWDFDDLKDLCKINSGMIYLITQMSFAPAIAPELYCAGMSDETSLHIPRAQIVSPAGVALNGAGFGLVMPMQNAPIDTWYSSDTGSQPVNGGGNTQTLKLRIYGNVLIPTDAVTIPELALCYSLTIYEIPSTELSAAFRDGVADSAKTVFRGGI